MIYDQCNHTNNLVIHIEYDEYDHVNDLHYFLMVVSAIQVDGYITKTKFILRSKERLYPVESYIDLYCISIEIDKGITFKRNMIVENVLDTISKYIRRLLSHKSEEYLMEYHNTVIDLKIEE